MSQASAAAAAAELKKSSRSEGNISGVRNGNSAGKAMSWSGSPSVYGALEAAIAVEALLHLRELPCPR